MWQAVVVVRHLVLLSVFSVASAACSDPCDRDAIADQLDVAAAGATVVVPSGCTVAGGLVVPAGVTLAGEDATVTIAIPSQGPGLVLASGGAPSTVRDLRITSEGGVALSSTGVGAVCVEDVRIEVQAGIGVRFEDLVEAKLEDVAVEGTVVGPTGGSASSHGVILRRVDDARLTRLDVTGFAMAGVVLLESQTTWTGGSANNNRNVGVFVEDGSAALDDVAIERTLPDPALFHGYAGYFDGAAVVDSVGLSVNDNTGFGLVHAGDVAPNPRPLGSHLALSAARNTKPAVWAQNTDALEVSGTLADNGSGGIVALDSANLRLHDLEIRDTQTVELTLETTSVSFGDGIQIVGPAPASTFEDLMIVNSGRAGLLVDLDGQTFPSTLTFDRVTVTTSGAIGARAQNGMVPPGWDTGITRVGTSSQADTLGPNIDPTGVIGPCERPPI